MNLVDVIITRVDIAFLMTAIESANTAAVH